MKSLAPEMGALTAGGILANRWARRKIKEMDDRDEEANGGRIGMAGGMSPKKIDSKKYAVLKFSGMNSDKNINFHEIKLKKYLSESQPLCTASA